MTEVATTGTDLPEIAVITGSLRRFYAEAFRALGVSPANSQTCADGVHHADRCGTVTHGAGLFNRLYLRMLRDGTVDPHAVPVVERDSAAVALVNGGNGLGFVTAAFGMRGAIERARRYGVGAVSVHNSSHCGCMGWYTGMALEAGMIGIALTNLGAQGILPPPGGRDRLLGTNVLAAAAPAGAAAPFNLDMSAAVVAAGKVRLARDRGMEVPPGWLADAAGRPVTDPGAYFDGRADLRFLGGAPVTGSYKGYGLAVLADILCGTLSGAGVGPDSATSHGAGRDDSDIGHFFLAIDVSAFRDLTGFRSDMDRMLGTLCASTPVDPDRPVGYPGLPEHRWRSATSDTVRLPAGVVGELESVAGELGIAPPARAGRLPESAPDQPTFAAGRTESPR